jgi:hypothetical protein
VTYAASSERRNAVTIPREAYSRASERVRFCIPPLLAL